MSSSTSDTSGEREIPGSFRTLVEASQQLGRAAAQEVADGPDAWLENVREAAQHLFEIIEGHQVRTEQPGGTLANVTVRKPGLMHARQRLEHEHADMLHRLRELDVEAERQIAAHDYNLEIVRLQVQVLRSILALHLARTDTLLYETYMRVEGGEG